MFWTVTGDNVTSLAFADVNRDGKQELIVGSADFEIRVFHDDDVLQEITETDKLIDLCHITPTGCVGAPHPPLCSPAC